MRASDEMVEFAIAVFDELKHPIDNVLAPTLRGLALGVDDLHQAILKHPIETCYQISLFTLDAAIIIAHASQNYQDRELQPCRDALLKPDSLFQKAHARMQERINHIKKYGAKFSTIDNPSKVEMAVRFFTNIYAQGTVIKAVQGLHNYGVLGKFNPNVYKLRNTTREWIAEFRSDFRFTLKNFLDQVRENIPRTTAADYLSIDKIREISKKAAETKTTFSYVIMRDGSFRAAHNVNGWAYGHYYLANGEPIVMGGELGLCNGRFFKIDNLSGHYVPRTETAVIKTVFQGLGVNEVNTQGVIQEFSKHASPYMRRGKAIHFERPHPLPVIATDMFHTHESYWEKLTASWSPLSLLPAIFSSQLQAEEKPPEKPITQLPAETAQLPSQNPTSNPSTEGYTMRQQFCTLPELAKFIASKPNAAVTLEEAKNFGMRDVILERAKSSGLISVSEDGGLLQLSMEAFRKQFPARTGQRTSMYGVLDRQNQCFTLADNLSTQEIQAAHEFFKYEVATFVRQQKLLIEELTVYHIENNKFGYKIKFVPARVTMLDEKTTHVTFDFQNKTEVELHETAKAKSALELHESAKYYEQLAEHPPKESINGILKTIEAKYLTKLHRKLGLPVQISALNQTSGPLSLKAVQLDQTAIAHGEHVIFDSKTRTIQLEKGFYSAGKNYAADLNALFEKFAINKTASVTYFDYELPGVSTTPIRYPEGAMEIPPQFNPDLAKVVGPHFREIAAPDVIQSAPQEAYRVDYSDAKVPDLKHKTLHERLRFSNNHPELYQGIRLVPVSDEVPPPAAAQSTPQAFQSTITRPQLRSTAGIIGALEAQGKNEFTLKELKEIGIPAERLKKWQRGSYPILRAIEGEKVTLQLDALHRKFHTRIYYPDKGEWVPHTRQFIPVKGFESQAASFVKSTLEMQAARLNLEIEKVVYYPETFTYRTQYKLYRVSEVSNATGFTTQITIDAANKTKAGCYLLAEHNAAQGNWCACDYYLQAADIAETPFASQIGKNILTAVLESDKPGQLLAISDKQCGVTPIAQGESVRLGDSLCEFRNKTRTITLSENLDKTKIVEFLGKHRLAAMGRNISSIALRMAKGPTLLFVGAVASLTNIARAESTQRARVATHEGMLHVGGFTGSTAAVLGAAALGFTPAGWSLLGLGLAGGVIGSEAATHRMHGKTAAKTLHHNHMPRFSAINDDQVLVGYQINPTCLGTKQSADSLTKTIQYYYAITPDGEVHIRDKEYVIKSEVNGCISTSDVIAAGVIILDRGKCIVNNESKYYQSCGPQLAPFVLEKIVQACHVDNPTFIYEPGTQYLERDKLPKNCILPKKLSAGRPRDCLFEAAPKTETRQDAVSQYETLLEQTMQETRGFYPSSDTQSTNQSRAQKRKTGLAEKKQLTKEAQVRAREINLRHIRITNLSTEILQKQAAAQDAYERYVQAVHEKMAAEKQAELGRELMSSVASYGDAVSKNLDNSGFKTAARVISSVANGISSTLSAKAIGTFVAGFTKSVALGTATAGIGFAIAALTTIMGICGGDDDAMARRLAEMEKQLHSLLDHRSDRSESLIHASRDAIRDDLRVLNYLARQMQYDIRDVMHTSLQTLQGVHALHHFSAEEAIVIRTQLNALQTQKLTFAHFQLTEYLTGREPTKLSQNTFDQIAFWLMEKLHEPVIDRSDDALLSSPHMMKILIEHPEFATLPSMPFFADLADNYLAGLEKAKKIPTFNALSKIKSTIELYLQFIDTVKNNPDVIKHFDEIEIDNREEELLNRLEDLHDYRAEFDSITERQAAAAMKSAKKSELHDMTDIEDEDGQYEKFTEETKQFCTAKGLQANSLWKTKAKKPGYRYAAVADENDRDQLTDALTQHGIFAEQKLIGSVNRVVVQLPTKSAKELSSAIGSVAR